MTPENRRANIQEELSRARESYQAAIVLFERKLYNDGVSRLYYAVFHLVRALLLSKGLEPKSHEGALKLLGLHFIKSGIFQPADSHIFARLMKYREEADYNPSSVFTAEDVREITEEAKSLEEKILTYLKNQNEL